MNSLHALAKGLTFTRALRAAGAALCGAVLVATSFWATATAQPVRPFGPKTLRLGGGDSIRVAVFQNTDLSLEVRVDGDGRISYPFLGLIEVAGKTTSEVEKAIAAALVEQGVLKRAQVSVSVSQLRSQQVAILGHVNRPGTYPLDLNYSVTGALALAGGVLPSGADRASLTRNNGANPQTTELDLVRLLKGGAGASGDVALQPGDVLFVPRAPMLYVYGQVQRPGAMRLEAGMTVQQALAASGGLNLRGSMNRLRITRQTATGSEELASVDLQTTLMPEDVVYVPESLF
jgi:polysaccharide biosynthesis/export protein